MDSRSRSKIVVFTSVVFVLSTSLDSRADIIIDQVGGGPNLIAAVNTSAEYQQEVTVGVAGDLVGIDLWSWGIGSNTNPITVGINLGTGWQTDAADISRTFAPTAPNQRMFVDFSSTPLAFDVGDRFLITLEGITSSSGWVAYGNNDYAGNSFFRNNVELASNDLSFQTHMSVSAVPEPSTYALFAFAAGVIAIRRRKGQGSCEQL